MRTRRIVAQRSFIHSLDSALRMHTKTLMQKFPTLAVVSVFAGATAGCTLMEPQDDPVQIRLNDLDARLQRIERVVTNQSLVDLAQRLDRLQSEVRTLRGEVETLENQTEGARTQQRNLYADIDKRLAALEGGGAGSAGGTSSIGATNAPGDATEQRTYDVAFEALKAGDYPRAIQGFRQFLANYPASPLASNAQYWLGEAYYVTRDYNNAGAAFLKAVEQWPDARKAPDALVKLGFTQFEQKRYGAARNTLNAVAERYPGTEAAKLAAERLKRFPPDAR
jgi:tol-pal system protein YbgF